jgi:tetratricopeptide (TPR) repeat protein
VPSVSSVVQRPRDASGIWPGACPYRIVSAVTSLRTSLPGLAAFAASDHPLAGRYVIEREIGSGGMAIVVLATDLRHNRHVAIKVLRAELSSTVNSDRFVREIEIAAGLTHPHILPVHDSGAEEGLLFYVMPYVEGETLAVRIAREGALSLDETMRLTRQIASALEYAHGQGFVHRDIKPENVLLPGGVAVVADFGLARALDSDSAGLRITEGNMALGTPTYLSPEQALGANDVDARTDQYSFACVVFEMLTGRPPFDGRTMQAMLAQHISKPAPKVSTITPGIPSGIESTLDRALAKHPGERFASVKEFVDALDRAVVGSATGLRKLITPARVAVAAVVVAVAFGAGALLRTVRTSIGRVDLDDNVIAVAPFDVLGPSLDLWREGLLDVLARSLDGAGPLRTVSPTIVMKTWKGGHADRTSAVDLGRRNRAGIAVFGQIIAAGGDSVRATVALYDVRGDSALSSELEVLDAASRLDRVADSITVRLLRTLSRTRRITGAPAASLGSHSVVALKAFLRGEQLYRRNDFAGARAEYQEAFVADSTFALVSHRIFDALRWLARGRGDTLAVFARRAGSLNHGLALRDSLIILADSLRPVQNEREAFDLAALARARRRLSALERATSLYPGDPEVWEELGQARARVLIAGSDPEATLFAFERAIAADSLFGPAYPNAIHLRLMLRGGDSALSLARRYLRLNQKDQRVPPQVEMLSGSRTDAALRRVVEKFGPADARDAAFAVASWPDPEETGVRLLRLLVSQSQADADVFLGAGLAFRGHIHEATAVNDLRFRHDIRGAADLLLYSRYSLPDARALDSLVTIWTSHATPEAFPIAIARATDKGDSTLLNRLASVSRQMASASTSAVDTLQWRYVEGLANAYLALVRADSTDALRRLVELPDSLAWPSYATLNSVLLEARLLSQRARGAEAVALLGRHPVSTFGVNIWQAMWHLEMARAAASAGDRPRARAAFAFVSAAWSNADSPLARELATCAAELRRQGVL